MNGHVEAIIFDLFHTLVDPEDFRPKDFHRPEAVASILKLDKARFLAFWANTFNQRMTSPRPEVEYVKDFARECGIELPAKALDEADRALGCYQDLAILNPRSDVVDALKSLNGGFRMGVLSNTVERDVREWPRSPLAEFFDATAFSHETGVMKPEKAAFSVILERLNVGSSSSVFVGDGGSQELIGAKNAGFNRVIFMRRFVAKNGLRSKEELETAAAQADTCVDSFGELTRIVSRLSSGRIR